MGSDNDGLIELPCGYEAGPASRRSHHARRIRSSRSTTRALPIGPICGVTTALPVRSAPFSAGRSRRLRAWTCGVFQICLPWISGSTLADCPFYSAIRFGVGDRRPSPLFVQCRLGAVGSRPRNLLVDLTNYVQFEIGQPTHSFDADRVSAIVVANANAPADITTLDGARPEDRPGRFVDPGRQRTHRPCRNHRRRVKCSYEYH